MTVDEIGPMRINSGLMEPEPSMPEIPIKPNTTIPVTIGILLILGGLMLGYSAYANLFSEPVTESQAEQFVDQSAQIGEDLTKQEVIDYFEELDNAGYYSTLGIIESIAALFLLFSGILLVRRMRLGVRVGVIGGALCMLDAAVSMYLLRSVESPSSLLSMTTNFTGLICCVCGMMCTILPLMSLFISSANAALLPALSTNESE